MILSFIPYLILKSRSKTSFIFEKKTESRLNSELTETRNCLGNQYLKLKLILYSTIFDFLQCLLLYLFCYDCIYNLWFFDILLISLFSYFILKTKLYRHQFFSMIIIIIFGLMLNIIEYYKLEDKDNKFDFFEIFMKFLCEIGLSLGIVIIKYNMVKTYSTPYEINFYEGLLELILIIIVLIIINQ